MLDIGTSTIRAGYAGDDTPKAVIPTCYGYAEEQEDGDINMEGTEEGVQVPKKKTTLYVGQSGPSVWRTGMHVAHPVQNSLST